LGRDLLNASRQDRVFDNAYQELTDGDYQEWQLGFELELPIGFRQAHAAVRNAELQLARERAVLIAQERDVTHDLASAVAEKKRAYAVARTNLNRRLAGENQLAALQEAFDRADLNNRARLLDLLLDAQRRLADAESRYYRSLAEYSLAVTQVHFQKGSLLEYNQVFLAEGPWPGKAYCDAARKNMLRTPPKRIHSFVLSDPPPVSSGPYLQRTPLPDFETAVREAPVDEPSTEPVPALDPSVRRLPPLPPHRLPEVRVSARN
jgi:hypothetical protein